MINVKLTDNQLLGLGVAALGVAIFVAVKARQAAKELGEAVNPVNNQNIFSRGVSAVVDVLDDGTRNNSNTLGTWIHGKINE